MLTTYEDLLLHCKQNNISPQSKILLKSFKIENIYYEIQLYKSPGKINDPFNPETSKNLGITGETLTNLSKDLKKIFGVKVYLQISDNIYTLIIRHTEKNTNLIYEILELILKSTNQKEYITKIQQLTNMKRIPPKFNKDTIDINKMHYKQRELYLTTIRTTEEITYQSTYENLSYFPNNDYLIYYAFKDLSNKLGFHFEPIEELENYQLNDDERYIVYRIVEKALNKY